MVTDIKSAKTAELRITKTKSIFQVSDKLTGKKTTIELKDIITKKKAEVEPLKDQLIKGLKTTRNDADVIELMNDLLNTK